MALVETPPSPLQQEVISCLPCWPPYQLLTPGVCLSVCQRWQPYSSALSTLNQHCFPDPFSPPPLLAVLRISLLVVPRWRFSEPLKMGVKARLETNLYLLGPY